ncbi:tail fiber protein [Bradyrhizobium diazoefficiens]|uniref:phage tail protein n=1 Tax=Bradyrhizobium diazoefficiens TaxID=1355477 RepID=UPI00190948D3|nr:tail fiber protein [Bradyrhizobium diazoefficiens]QQO30742.1 tail fiber protein [Bradyrhizobium diazoefficiens]
MPDDANGVYSLPNGYLAVTGTTIQPSQHNPPLEDVATALSARLSRNGSAPMTGPLKAADGAVGAPSYTFNTAQTTGFYKTASGNIGVSIAGAEVAEFSAGGMVKGGKFVGEIFDWTGSTAPALCVLAYGQTLSRTTYAALWAFAQTEIAAGNTLYNNGDGSTTFGIADLRGRVRAGKDNMGGSAASRLTSSYFGANASTLGAPGGLESNTLTTAQMPIHNHGVNDPGHSHTVNVGTGGGGSIAAQGTGSFGAVPAVNSSSTGISIQNAGSGSAHNNVQPTIITNACLFAGA